MSSLSSRARCHGRKMIFGQSPFIPMPMVPVSQGQRERDETEDGQMNRRERGSLWRLFRENTNTFLNDILLHVGMIPDSVDQMLAGVDLAGMIHVLVMSISGASILQTQPEYVDVLLRRSIQCLVGVRWGGGYRC